MVYSRFGSEGGQTGKLNLVKQVGMSCSIEDSWGCREVLQSVYFIVVVFLELVGEHLYLERDWSWFRLTQYIKQKMS